MYFPILFPFKSLKIKRLQKTNGPTILKLKFSFNIPIRDSITINIIDIIEKIIASIRNDKNV